MVHNSLIVNSKAVGKDKECVVFGLGLNRVKDFYYRKSLWKQCVNVFSSFDEMANGEWLRLICQDMFKGI